MNNINIILVALYRYRNFPIRIMHPLLEKISGVKPYTIFFKNCDANAFRPPTQNEENLFVELIIKLKPKIVGFSVLSPYAPIASRLTKLIKEHSPSTLIIWGGVHPTISPETCLDEADALCIGEGEDAMSELAQCVRDGKPYHSIQNLWIKDGDRIIKNPMRPLIQDLDALPFPSYGNDGYYFIDSNKISQKDPTIYDIPACIQTSRGCPYACTYCANSLLHPIFKGLGPYTRRRSVDNVLQEITQNNVTDSIFFIDEVFGIDEAWLDEFATKYKKEVGLPFFAEYNPKVLNEKILKKLNEACIGTIIFGIQTGSDYIRNEIFRRPGKNSEIIKLANEIVKHNIKVKYDLIVDNPYETEETLKECIELLFQFPKPLFFNLASLQYFPGYPLTEKAIKDKHILPESASVDTLVEVTTKGWNYRPRLFPYTKKQVLQNIIWLIVWNHVKDNTARYAVLGKTLGSKVCLTYLNLKSILLGSVFGIGGFIWKNPWIATLKNAVKYVTQGDFRTVYAKIKRRIS